LFVGASLLGAVHKRRPQSGGGGLSSADILRTRGEGVLQVRTSALFVAKNCGYFEIYGVSARTRWRGCWASTDKGGGGQLFSILCGRRLWTAPY